MEKTITELASNFSQQLKPNEIEDTSPEIRFCSNLINITLLDNKNNFKRISPFKLNKSLNIISETWEWVKFSNNYQTLTIKEFHEIK